MSTISATAVKTLRDRTNAPMMDCKAALTEAGGDMDKAIEILRKKSKDIAVKREGKETAEGRVGIFIDPAKKVGAIIEVRCESAPVAKSDLFIELANDLARQAAFSSASTVDELMNEPCIGDKSKKVSERVGDVVGVIRENMKPARFTRLTGLLGSYVHHDGSVGVLLQVEGGDTADAQMLRDVSMHVTARNPMAARRQDVDPATVDKEKEIAKSQIAADPKNARKPANILAMIIEGKMKTFFEENVLEDQPFVKDDKQTVAQLLGAAGLKVVRFVRYKVGEVA
jgi:elongation factor Ts